MDTGSQPGIKFLGVDLLDLRFAIEGEIPETIPCGLRLKVASELSEDSKILDILVNTDLFGALEEEDRPPITFEFTLHGRFEATEQTSITMQDFAGHNAPANLVPYARELIANITSRSILPTLNLGPVNVIAMIDKGIAEFVIHEAPKPSQEIP